MANYIQYKIRVNGEEQAEILTALLSDFPFESFESENEYLCAYIPSTTLEPHIEDIEQILGDTEYYSTEIQAQNWNAEWESNFEEVVIDDKVIIRAPFHAHRPEFGNLEVVIQPKMSFGTGHHSTTRLMVEMMLGLDLNGSSLLDMGSGTGVLAIVASKLGAKRVLAIEIDDMAEESVRENIEINGVGAIVTSVCGDASAIGNECFDTILANINRNILLNDMATYRRSLSTGARLIISGFLAEDVDILTTHASSLDLESRRVLSHDGWYAIEFVAI